MAVRLNTNEAPEPPPAASPRSSPSASAPSTGTATRTGPPPRCEPSSPPTTASTRRWSSSPTGRTRCSRRCCLAYGGPGRTAALFEPTYALHSHIARITGTDVAIGERRDDFTIDLDEVRRVLAEAEPAITFLCSPNNPTGTIDPPEVLAEVLVAAPGLVVVDEAYGQFAPARPSATWLADRPLVVVRTFSKTWSMAAARLGYCVAPPAVVEALEKVVLPYHLDAVKQIAGELALDFEAEMRARVAALVEERGRLVARLDGPRRRRLPVGANFVLFRPRRLDGKEVWQGLARPLGARARLLVVAPARGVPAGDDRHRRPRTTPSSPPSRRCWHDDRSFGDQAADDEGDGDRGRHRPRRRRRRRSAPACRSSTTCSTSSAATAASASTVEAEGDLHVDGHHTVEDTGIILGEAFREALGDKAGVARFASGLFPLDEALVEVALDLSGRPFVVWDVPFGEVLPLGDPPFNPEMAGHFWQSFATAAGITLHVRKRAGENTHHVVEASFKGVARCLRAGGQDRRRRRPLDQGRCSEQRWEAGMTTLHDPAATHVGPHDPALTERAIEHVRAGTTDLSPSVLRVPLWYYGDATVLEREEALLRRTPIAVVPSARVAARDDFVVRDVLGTSVLVTRGDDGVVRAFLNYCRHRGARPADGCGNARRFTCPYHAWTYDGEGQLVGLPGARGFEEVDRSTAGLVALPCEERHGLVWVVLTAGRSARPRRPPRPARRRARRVGPRRRYQHLRRARSSSPTSSWKAALEAFAESYHFPYVHAKSLIGMNTIPDIGVHDALGPHHRICFPYPWIRQHLTRADVDAWLPSTTWRSSTGCSRTSFSQSARWAWSSLTSSRVTPRLAASCATGGWPSDPAATDDDRAGYDALFEQVHAAVRRRGLRHAAQCGDGIRNGQHDHMLIGRNEIGVQHVVRSFAAALDLDLRAKVAPPSTPS